MCALLRHNTVVTRSFSATYTARAASAATATAADTTAPVIKTVTEEAAAVLIAGDDRGTAAEAETETERERDRGRDSED